MNVDDLSSIAPGIALEIMYGIDPHRGVEDADLGAYIAQYWVSALRKMVDEVDPDHDMRPFIRQIDRVFQWLNSSSLPSALIIATGVRIIQLIQATPGLLEASRLASLRVFTRENAAVLGEFV